MNTWTPNGSGSQDHTPAGGSPEFKYKHFSLLNQFNQAPTANKGAYKTTNFQDTGTASDLSSQLLAIQNSIGSAAKGQRTHARTAAANNRDRQHSAYARIGVAGALHSKQKQKAGANGPSFAQIELANYKNMDPNRILNKENRQTNSTLAGSFAAQSVALAGNRFTQSSKGAQQRGYSTGTPKKHGSSTGLQHSSETSGRVGRSSA